MHFMCEKLHMQTRVHIFEIWKTNNYTSVVNMNKFIFFRSVNVEAVAKTLSRGSETVKQRLLNHAKTCVQLLQATIIVELKGSSASV